MYVDKWHLLQYEAPATHLHSHVPPPVPVRMCHVVTVLYDVMARDLHVRSSTVTVNAIISVTSLLVDV